MDLAGWYLCEAVFHADFKSVSLFGLWPCISTHKKIKVLGIFGLFDYFCEQSYQTYQWIWRSKRPIGILFSMVSPLIFLRNIPIKHSFHGDFRQRWVKMITIQIFIWPLHSPKILWEIVWKSSRYFVMISAAVTDRISLGNFSICQKSKVFRRKINQTRTEHFSVQPTSPDGRIQKRSLLAL